jgi:arylsulfatase A-like enzyme
MKKIFLIWFVLLLIFQFAYSQSSKPLTEAKRPNIVIILADDMGYSDMGMFGSEIKTPNMDSLALTGVRFTNFYTHASCSPSRSMLLSGVDTHLN